MRPVEAVPTTKSEATPPRTLLESNERQNATSTETTKPLLCLSRGIKLIAAPISQTRKHWLISAPTPTQINIAAVTAPLRIQCRLSNTAASKNVERPPAKFGRTRGSQPLPEPERGGSLDELRRFFNVDHHGWILIRAFLVAALRPRFPLPILVVKGEQGSGKSTACRVISSLIDPRTSALRRAA